jgi:phage baseplate assembly protein W
MAYEFIQLESLQTTSNIAYGIDISFNNRGVFSSVYNQLRQITANLKNLLSTVPGERFYQPSYGCNLIALLYEPNSYELKEEIYTTIAESINRWLPYMEIVDINIQTHEDNPNLPHDVQVTLLTSYNGIELNPVTVFVNESGILTLN